MSTALLDPPSLTLADEAGPRPYRWTCDEFHNLGDRGFFEGTSVILVDGKVLAMPSPNPPHSTATILADNVLREVFRVGHFIRNQTSLPLGLDTDPVPDLAVVVGSPRDYSTSHPTTAVLIVEVADSSIAYDRGEKSNLYAAAGIRDYWVIDVNARQLIVFRDPIADPSAPRGARYASVQELTAADRIAPLAAPDASVRVADLVP